MARLLMDGLREYFLTQRRHAAQAIRLREGRFSRRARAPRAPASLRRRWPRRSSRTSPRSGATSTPCSRAAWRTVRHRPEGVSADARSACGRRLSGSAGARARSARRDGRVHGEPLSARIALSPPAGRRVPGHERRAVAAGLAARAVVARGQRPGRRPAARADDLRRRRPQAVDLWLSRRRRRRAAPRGRPRRRAPSRTGRRPSARSVEASAPCRRCSRSRTRCSTPVEKLPDRADAFTYEEKDRFPVDDARGRRRRSGARARSPRPMATRARAPSPPRSRGCSSTGTVRDRQTGVARPAASGRHRDPVPHARGPPGVRARARGARASAATSTRVSASSTPTRSRMSSRSCAISPIHRPIFAPPHSSDRDSSGLSDRALAIAVAPNSRPHVHRRPVDVRRRSMQTIAPCSRAFGRPCPAGSRWPTACRRRSCWIAVLAESAYFWELTGPARRSGAGEPEEDSRRSCAASRIAATPRWRA